MTLQKAIEHIETFRKWQGTMNQLPPEIITAIDTILEAVKRKVKQKKLKNNG